LVKKNETLDTFKIKNFIKNNKCVLVINSPKHDLFKQLSIVGDDFNNSAILFFYNPYIEKVLPLIKISLVPNEKTVKEQIENKLSLFLFEKNIKTLEHTSPMFNIKIYLSNLLLTNLEKYHFGEIVAST
jgi:hypothetical protein